MFMIKRLVDGNQNSLVITKYDLIFNIEYITITNPQVDKLTSKRTQSTYPVVTGN